MTNTCPICHKNVSHEHAPFCSERCQKVDLGRWFGGNYGIASETPPSEEELEQLIEVMETQSGQQNH